MPLSPSQRLAAMDISRLYGKSRLTSAAGAMVLRWCKKEGGIARTEGAVWDPYLPEAHRPQGQPSRVQA